MPLYQKAFEDDLEDEVVEGQEGKFQKIDENDDTPKDPEEETWKKRYSDLRRYSTTKTQELEDKIEALSQKLQETEQKKFAPPKSDEELEEWVKEYPHVAAVIQTLAMKEAQKISSQTEGQLRELKEDRERRIKREAYASLLNVHPDFEELKSDDDFLYWVENEATASQKKALMSGTNWQDAADAVTVFKVKYDRLNKKESKKGSTSNKNAADSVKTRSTSSRPVSNTNAYDFSESQVEAMSSHEYDRRSGEIEKAIREGRFLYDLSAKAS